MVSRAAKTRTMKNLKTLADDVRPLAILAEINQALTVAQSPRAGLQRALELLDHDYGVIRSAVVLADPDTGRLRVEASAGLTGAGRHAEWEMGEGNHRARGSQRQAGRRAADQPGTDVSPPDRTTAAGGALGDHVHVGADPGRATVDWRAERRFPLREDAYLRSRPACLSRRVNHVWSGDSPPTGRRGRASAAARRKPPLEGGVETALRLFPHHRDERAHAAGSTSRSRVSPQPTRPS